MKREKIVDFEVIVIGGGPAGSAAAITLAKAGISVCIVDKAMFPRQKLCGGLLSLRSKKLFETIFGGVWNAAIVSRSRGVSFFNRSQLMSSVQDYRDWALTDRTLFDSMLLQKAQKAGAEVITGIAVTSINEDQYIVSLADGRQLSSNYIVGCDGIYGISVKTLHKQSFRSKQTSFCLEIDVPLCQTTYCITEPEIYFGYVRWGYGWIFPKGDKLTVGLGCLMHKNADIVAAFKAFLVDRLGFMPELPLKGHHLVFRNRHWLAGKGNVLLCGDAAGWVDPLTGEGIAYAMQSGNLAAKAIINVLSNTTSESALKQYSKSCEPIRKEIKLAERLSWLVFPKYPERLFLKTFPRTKTIPRRFIDLMSGITSYQEFQRFILSKIVSRLTGSSKK
ncbi:MAG: geranylgeranyl reductase family protein [Candidatus Cloacimonas sp.]|nr:geranylgeranyl reductase family protein [Candidatus Cloacimonas sp.]